MVQLLTRNPRWIGEPLLTCDLVTGVTLEVADLFATRAFYEPIFDRDGQWTEQTGILTFGRGRQRIEFVRHARPTTWPKSGRHQAYRVAPARLKTLADELARRGDVVDWWHEDFPPEREVAPYLLDPSGNRVQLVPSDEPGLLIDHLGVEVLASDPAELFYLKVLGGTVNYYHGRQMEHFAEAQSWSGGSDPCAPWTRLWVRLMGVQHDQRRLVRPNQQIFCRFGPSVVGLIMAVEHWQEPLEERRKGTPRVIFHTPQTADEVASLLAHPPISLHPEGRMDLAFRRAGRNIYLRDPFGNFIEIDCE